MDWWPFKQIQCKKPTHFHCAVLLHFCFAIHPSRTVPQRDDPEIFVPVTKALQPSFEAPPMAPANMETLVAESTGCKATPSRFTLNKRSATRIYPFNAYDRLKLFKDPAPCSEVFLDKIDYKKSHTFPMTA